MKARPAKMFHNIPKEFLDRMQHLESVDARDRRDGTPRSLRLRQISRETGRFIALLAATAPEGDCIEIGTSAGYSTLWLALARRAAERGVVTFEASAEKVGLARETFRLTGLEDVVRCIEGDAREYLTDYDRTSFCFLDAEKEVYLSCYETVIPRMLRGGLLVADNVISHREILEPFIERALRDERADALTVPIGSGLLVCRKL